MKDLHFRRPLASRVGQHVKVSEQGLTVGKDKGIPAATPTSTTFMDSIRTSVITCDRCAPSAMLIDGLGRALAASFAALHDPMAFLFLSMAALIVIGFVLEGFPAILIAAPILLPVAERMAIDPLQYGILLVMAIGIGVFMPPVGIGFYVACAIGEAPAAITMRPSLIYSIFLLLGLLGAIIFPGVTLGLPHVLGLR